MLEEIGFEGIFDAEFLIGPDDKYYFLEINFRNTTWSYASDVLGMPLAYTWVKSTLGGGNFRRCLQAQSGANTLYGRTHRLQSSLQEKRLQQGEVVWRAAEEQMQGLLELARPATFYSDA